MHILSYDDRRVCRYEKELSHVMLKRVIECQHLSPTLLVNSLKKYLLCTYYVQMELPW